jgi:Tfp pilus assembly protein PilO
MATGWKNNYTRYKDFFLNVLNVYESQPTLKMYLELMLSVVAMIVFSLFAVKPTILTIIDLNKEIKAKEIVSTELKQKIRNLQTANNLMQTESSNLPYLDQAIPKASTPETLVKQIEILGSESQLKTISFALSDAILYGQEKGTKRVSEFGELAEGSNELSFDYSATGSYQDMLNFIKKLEDLRRPVKIDSFLINSTTTESGKVLILTISGRVPFFLTDK